MSKPAAPPARPAPSLARSTLWNLSGQCLPLAVAVLAIPFLIAGLGRDRFGVLNLAWVVIGYFGLFDLGLGRAMTRVVAEKIGAGREREIPVLFWTILSFMFLLGCLGMMVGLALSPWLADRLLTIPAALRHETLLAFMLLALVLPVDLTSAGLRGALEAVGRFDLTGRLRVITGLFNYLAPLAVLALSTSLVAIVAVLVLGRLGAWGAALLLCRRVIPALQGRPRLDRAVLGPLLRMGGWMNASGVVYPLMVTLDRFMIGSLVSVAAVAYYATSYEIVTRLWVLPAAIAGVLFPTFAAGFGTDRPRTARLFAGGVRYIFLAIFPAVLVIVTFAREGLTLWLDADFAAHGGRVLQLLAIGVCVNSLSNVPFALIQGAGRPDLPAKLHLVELPLYVTAVWLMASLVGITGVAIVWLARGVIDTIVLFVLAHRLLGLRAWPLRRPVLAVAVFLLVAAFVLFPVTPAAKMLFLLLALTAFGLMGWYDVLVAAERALVLRRLTGLRVRRPAVRLTPDAVDLG